MSRTPEEARRRKLCPDPGYSKGEEVWVLRQWKGGSLRWFQAQIDTQHTYSTMLKIASKPGPNGGKLNVYEHHPYYSIKPRADLRTQRLLKHRPHPCIHNGVIGTLDPVLGTFTPTQYARLA